MPKRKVFFKQNLNLFLLLFLIFQFFFFHLIFFVASFFFSAIRLFLKCFSSQMKNKRFSTHIHDFIYISVVLFFYYVDFANNLLFSSIYFFFICIQTLEFPFDLNIIRNRSSDDIVVLLLIFVIFFVFFFFFFFFEEIVHFQNQIKCLLCNKKELSITHFLFIKQYNVKIIIIFFISI